MQLRNSGLLERALRRWRRAAKTEAVTVIDLAPSSGFDVLIQERIRGLEDGLREIKSRVNGLIFLVAGVVIVQVVLRVVS